MNRFLFLKVDRETKSTKAPRTPRAPSMDPKLLVLMNARYV